MTIPFDLELAWEAQNLSMGRILTRGGEEVMLIRDVRKDQIESVKYPISVEYPILGIKLGDNLNFLSWTPEGVFWKGKEDNNDLLYIEVT